MSLPETQSSDTKVPWFLTQKSVFLGLVIFGPLALPLVWVTPKLSIAKKIFWTILMGVLTALLWKYSMDMMGLLNRRMEELKALGLS